MKEFLRWIEKVEVGIDGEMVSGKWGLLGWVGLVEDYEIFFIFVLRYCDIFGGSSKGRYNSSW